MLKRVYFAFVVVTAVLVIAMPVGASALLEESAGVNLPGWLGWLLAALALILPMAVSAWLRNRSS